MPKLIPEGGKRDIQIKVHLNKPESHDLEDLAKFYGSDRASALRKLLANWSFLQKYIWLGFLVLGLINLIYYFKGVENIYSSISLLVLSLVMFWQRKDSI